MNSSMINKIAKAKRYAEEPERVQFKNRVLFSSYCVAVEPFRLLPAIPSHGRMSEPDANSSSLTNRGGTRPVELAEQRRRVMAR
ncbi:MAG TPA: hypothetical protein VII61_03255 [Ktedonobacteraceae bacterium]